MEAIHMVQSRVIADRSNTYASTQRQRWIYLPVFLAFWSTMILADVVHDLLEVRILGLPDKDLATLLFEWRAYWGTWVAVSLSVIPLVSRFNPDRTSWRWTAVVHATASLVLTVIHLTLLAVAVEIPWWNFPHQVLVFLFQYGIRDATIYCLLVATLIMWHLWLVKGRREVEVARATARADRLELLASDQRLETLRRELNPHFLFNSLNSVAALVRRGDGPIAVALLSRLSSLLRRSLDTRGKALVPFADELAHIQEYLSIEELRFGDRLQVSWDIDPTGQDVKVPFMVLQPIVENSIVHGVARSTKPVRIEISSRLVGDALLLSVKNDGPTSPSPTKEGLGLSNSRERLCLCLGASSSIVFQHNPEGGGTTLVRMPLLTDFIEPTPLSSGPHHGLF